MTKETKEDWHRFARWLVAAIGIPLASWAFMKYDASKLDVSRYEREQAGVSAKLNRILDVACDGRKAIVRACTEP